MQTTEQMMEQAVRDGIREGVKANLMSTYRGPLNDTIESVMKSLEGEFRSLIMEGVQGATSDPDFRDEIKSAMRRMLAKSLVQKIGGEMEKQINALKADPATRARITLAIDGIVSSQA